MKRRRSDGYTLIEVMMAMAILAIGATGMMALQTAVIRGNSEANQLTIATRIAEMWVDRVRLDALGWRQSGTAGSTAIALTNTSLLRLAPATGSSGWVFPPAAGVFAGGPSFGPEGNPTSLTPTHFCTQLNLTWVYPNTALRVDVRVQYPRTSTRRAVPSLGCAATPTAELHHMVRASTVVRFTPFEARRRK